MGTRHIVEVIHNNKTAIRQYGQWDGYANSAGLHLRDFIKEHGVKKVRELIDMTEIQNTSVDSLDSFHIHESILGVNTSDVDEYIDKVKRLASFYRFGISDTSLAIIPAVVEKFGFEKAVTHYMMTRDTGYKILDVIGLFSCFDEIQYEHHKIPVFLEDEDMDTGRKIIINLDNEIFSLRYFGKEKSWSFNKLPTKRELDQVDKW